MVVLKIVAVQAGSGRLSIIRMMKATIHPQVLKKK
jgi:hypothetical protein